MTGRVRRCPRGIVFLAARPLAADPVGIRAPQTGRFNGLVRVDADPALCCLLQHALEVIHGKLAVVPFVVRHPGGVDALQAATVSNIASLYLPHTE